MCVPPFVEPARKCFGCISLRHAAGAVLVLDAAYGLTLVVLHAVLLGERGPAVAEGSTTSTLSPTEHEDHWLLQFADLDMSWGHRLLGFRDQSCLVAGLLYGLLVVAASVFTLNVLFLSGGRGPQQTGFSGPMSLLTLRWYTVFMHVQMVLYLGVCLAKFPILCELREAHFPALEKNCDVLRYIFTERFLYGMVLGSLCLWTFGSFAYLKGAAGETEEYLSDDSDLGFGQRQQPTSRLRGLRNYALAAPRRFGDMLSGGTVVGPTTRVAPYSTSSGAQSFALPSHSASFFTETDRRVSFGGSYPQETIPRSLTASTAAYPGRSLGGGVPVAQSFAGGGSRSVIKPPLGAY